LKIFRLFVSVFLLSAFVFRADAAEDYSKNVKRRKAEVYIDRIPQVSQKRSYCCPASASMIIRYFDGRVSQKRLAKLFSTSRKQGTFSSEMLDEFSKGRLRDYEIKRIYALTNGEALNMLNAYNAANSKGGKKRKSGKNVPIKLDGSMFSKMNPAIARRVIPGQRQQLAELMTKVFANCIDQGIPVMWAVTMNLDPNDRMDGGHMRIITGYVKENGRITKVIYRDPWGGREILKRMSFNDALTITLELHVITPKELNFFASNGE
jgi:hypothetical protein